jgi:hypothetical protein
LHHSGASEKIQGKAGGPSTEVARPKPVNVKSAAKCDNKPDSTGLSRADLRCTYGNESNEQQAFRKLDGDRYLYRQEITVIAVTFQ